MSFRRDEYDNLYTLLERIFPKLKDDPEAQRDAEYFMDRCEEVIGPLRRQGERLNKNKNSITGPKG
jgi:hypothetical protein